MIIDLYENNKYLKEESVSNSVYSNIKNYFNSEDFKIYQITDKVLYNELDNLFINLGLHEDNQNNPDRYWISGESYLIEHNNTVQFLIAYRCTSSCCGEIEDNIKISSIDFNVLNLINYIITNKEIN